LEFGVFSLRVIHSLHGILQRAPNMPPIPGPPPPEIFPPDAKPPFHLRDYVQGGTLAYFIRLNGVKLLVFGSMNYIEREVEGLRPDAALIGAMPERREIHHYTARLLRALPLRRPQIGCQCHSLDAAQGHDDTTSPANAESLCISRSLRPATSRSTCTMFGGADVCAIVHKELTRHTLTPAISADTPSTSEHTIIAVSTGFRRNLHKIVSKL
jgi:hypothetical protein